MPSDRSRHQLYVRLVEVLGEEEAAALMDHLPVSGWGDLPSRHDVEREIALLRAELHAEMAGLRVELKDEIAGLRVELKDEIAGLRREMHAGFREQTRMFVLTNVASVATVAGLVLAAVRL